MTDQMNQRQKNDLDNYITGHYGEDNIKDDYVPYVLQLDEKSFCRYCSKSVELLTPEFPEGGTEYTAFYICFDCRKIFQIGRGEVKRVET